MRDNLHDSIHIGQKLIDEGVITSEQLDIGLKEQRKKKEFICTTLVRLGFASEEQVFDILSRQLDIPFAKLNDRDVEPLVIKKVPAKFAIHYKIIPLEFKNNTLVIGMSNPLDVRMLDDLRLLLGVEVKPLLATETEIDKAIRKYYGVGADTIEKIIDQKASSEETKSDLEEVQDIKSLSEDASIIKFVNQILSEAIKDRATDIHIEPFQNELKVRFRIDGVLYNIHIPETIKYFHSAIISRIKIMAHLNIAEHRLPQDGRIKIRVDNEELDLRISVLPTAFGEAIDLRILSSGSLLELDKIGLSETNLKIIKNAIKKPNGIIFVTGPTGSGKSTTLYACLARINSEQIKIITIEDPIEYQLKGINQIQVMSKIGLDFATGLRHILRHDPDVIMIGEVRDFETAEIAIRSSLTGHLVLSTLHTNDAAGTVTRLLDMGVEPFLVSSSLECLVAQRLVRLICPKCKTVIEPGKKELVIKQIIDNNIECDPKNAELYEGKGCKECRFTGYHDRTGIHEVLVINEPIRELILARASSQQIKQKAISQGMLTLRQDGFKKVQQGLTTISEVIRVTQEEELVSE